MAQRSRSGSPSYLFKFDDRFATLRDPGDEIRSRGTVVVLASLSHEIVDRNDARHFPGLDDRSVQNIRFVNLIQKLNTAFQFNLISGNCCSKASNQVIFIPALIDNKMTYRFFLSIDSFVQLPDKFAAILLLSCTSELYLFTVC